MFFFKCISRLYGKWHAGYAKESYTPVERGFEFHIGHYQYAIDPFSKFNVDAWENGRDWFVNGQFQGDETYAGDLLLGMWLFF